MDLVGNICLISSDLVALSQSFLIDFAAVVHASLYSIGSTTFGSVFFFLFCRI